MSDEKEFTPGIIDEERGYGIVLVRLRECSYCGAWMFDEQKAFSNIGKNEIREQLKRAKWERQGELGMATLGTLICTKCIENGAESLECALCKKEKKSFEIKKCIGYPAEYLCKECYSTVSAEIWDIKVNELEENHKWDYEYYFLYQEGI